MDIGKRRTVMLLILLLAGANGCAAVPLGGAGAGAGVGTYSYIEGILEMEYAAPVSQVWEATLEALDQLKVEPTLTRNDAFGGRIEGQLSDGKSVTIKLNRKAVEITEVSVKIGTFGNRERSQLIQETIAARLSRT